MLLGMAHETSIAHIFAFFRSMSTKEPWKIPGMRVKRELAPKKGEISHKKGGRRAKVFWKMGLDQAGVQPQIWKEGESLIQTSWVQTIRADGHQAHTKKAQHSLHQHSADVQGDGMSLKQMIIERGDSAKLI